MPSNIRKFQIIATALAVLFIIYFFAFSLTAKKQKEVVPDKAEIVLTDKGFVPDEVFIKANGTVTFSTNRDKPFWPASNLHPTHGIYFEFDPRHQLNQGEVWTFQFNRAGDWGYHDHLRSYFTGKIHVVE